jgi:hypothetical protein
MTPEIIRNLAQFMHRVDLKGSEVAAWTECMNALDSLMKDQQTKTQPQQEINYDTP